MGRIQHLAIASQDPEKQAAYLKSPRPDRSDNKPGRGRWYKAAYPVNDRSARLPMSCWSGLRGGGTASGEMPNRTM